MVLLGFCAGVIEMGVTDSMMIAVIFRNRLYFCDMQCQRQRVFLELRGYQWLEWWAEEQIKKLERRLGE